MVKRKIGILVFTDKIKFRGTRKNLYFDSEKYKGFKYIISEIDQKENDIRYISRKQIEECDYVLISITSYMDVQNLINELKDVNRKKCKIIVGVQELQI